MRVIMIEAIERRLAETSPNALLRELATSEALLTSPSNSTRVALVSYRQESSSVSAASTADADPDLTLDGEAFLSAIAAAKRGGLDAVWLDAWCYRFTGEYDHENFCATLCEVISRVQAVVWLRRSKAAACGTYGYRLWCTFEAACVEQLKLPVLAAGHELSRRQKALATFGSFAASTGCLGGDGVTDQLCFVNFLMYAILILACIRQGAWFGAGIYTTASDVRSEAPLLVFVLVVWMGFRGMGSLSHQRLLAQNTRRVMRTMLRGRGEAATGTLSLLCDLPWLPTFDRRDVLVVQRLLTRIAPAGERVRVRAAGRALAFSAYAAAACAPAPGDGDPRNKTIGEWLRERNIAPDMLAADANREAAGEEAGAALLVLPMMELCLFGWRRLRGSSSCCALVLPTGFYIATRPPERSGQEEVWTVNTDAIELLPQHTTHRVWASSGLILAGSRLIATVWAILVGTGAVDVGDDVSYEASSASRWVDSGLTAFVVAVLIAAYAWTVKNDHPRLRCGRAPIPFLYFTPRELNWVAVAAWSAFSVGVPMWSLLVYGLNDARGWLYLLLAFALSYDFCAVIWYTDKYHRHYVAPSHVHVAGNAGFTLSPSALAANAAAWRGVGGGDRPPQDA